MANSFTPRDLGITAFMTPRGVDFVLEGPNQKAVRATAFYGNTASLKLNGKGVKVTSVELDDDGTPTRLVIKYGRDTLTLGRRTKATGPVSFYRSLEAQNIAAAPRTDEDVLNALQGLIA